MCQARKTESVVRLRVRAPRGRGSQWEQKEAREPRMVDVEWDGALELITFSVGGPNVMGG